MEQSTKKPRSNYLGRFLKPYWQLIIILIVVVIAENGLNLLIPKIVGNSLDSFLKNPDYNISTDLIFLVFTLVGILIFSLGQVILSNYVSEKIARDLRKSLSQKIATQSYNWINNTGSSELLTNITSDVDSVKNIISQGFVNAFSAAVILIGSVILLFNLNPSLTLIAISVLPIVAITFGYVFKNVSKFFRLAQENISRINNVVNESIVGATLVRVLNSQKWEENKFEKVSQTSRNIGYKIVNQFSMVIPIVNLVSNIATALILWYGGNKVITGELSIGQFSQFINYYNLLIMPIFIISAVSNIISRSVISLGRIYTVLDSKKDHKSELKDKAENTVVKEIKGEVEFQNIVLKYGQRTALKNVSFKIKPGTKNAILGPTAAGKTQIFSLLTSLVEPDEGRILIDGIDLQDFDKKSLFSQLGLVFQDSIIFNTTLRENISFSEDFQKDKTKKNEVDILLQKAIQTATLEDLITSLPDGLETQISERGSNLSGGQKQRLMLARSLAINPKILLLDDFTARVDINTEKQILKNLSQNYPDLTLISITQKIDPIKDYDQIFLFMEGELLASGKHDYLLQNSLEYEQIWESQQSAE
jgi:ATP-binding cassette subfamily B protein